MIRPAARRLLRAFPIALALAVPVRGAELPPPRIESVTGTGYRVEAPIGEPVVSRASVLGWDLAEIDLPEAQPEIVRRGVVLPARTLFLRVPWGVEVSVRSRAGIARSLGALRPVPFPRLVSEPSLRERLGPEEIGAALRAGSETRAPGIAPSPPLHETRAMAAGDERVLAVTLRPVTWDPTTGEARVVEEVTLEVSWDRPIEALAPAPSAGAPAPPAMTAPARGRAASSTTPRAALGPSYASAPARARALAAAGPLRVDPSRPWVALGVVRPGLYQLAPSDLATAGVPVGSIDPATFRIFRATPGDLPEGVDVDLGPDSLRECAIEVTGSGDGAFDTGDRIYFYATGATGFGYDLVRGGGPEYQETQHSDVETLWLTWGAGSIATPPRRIEARDAVPQTPGAPLLTSVTHRVHFEQNRLPNFHLYRPPLRWERWFDRQLTQGARVAITVRPPGLEPGTAADVRVRMWGIGNSTGAMHPDHVVRIYWNRVLADTAGWDLSEPQDIRASGLRADDPDTLEIEIPVFVDPDFPRLDRQYLTWFELGYRRRLAAANDTLAFAAPDSVPAGRVQYAIGSITDTTAAWLLDRTDPETPVKLVSGLWTGAAPSFTLTVEDSAGPGYRPRYTLLSTARAARPSSVALYAPASSPRAIADLLDPGNGADYLIVAPPAFLAAAETLAVYRSTRVLGIPSPRVGIATTDRIFAQFGSGRPSPVAIRNLVLYASRHWISPPPTYLCLLGDATFDPKNYQGFGAPDLVPTYSGYYDFSLLTQFTSDDFYALLDGPSDQLLDLAVGRLPAGNTPEAMSLVTGKLRAFESNAEFDIWRARAIFCADDAQENNLSDPLGNDHVQQMERKDGLHLPFPVERAKVYLNDFAFADTTRQTKPAAREELIAQINRGAWLTDYIGHGSEDVLAHEQVFRASDAARLTNASRPAIFGYFSCTVGKFDEPSGEGLGEFLLTIPNGGAVASLAATDLAFGGRSTILNDDFVEELFPLAPRVDSLRTAGLAFARSKNASAGPSNYSARKYNLQGDPALVPPLPRGRGLWEKAPLDSLVRGDPAVLRGHALAGSDSTPDTLSTGLVDVLIQGPPIVRTQIAEFGSPRQNYLIPGPTLYRGQVPLDRGSFEVRFVVPIDGRLVGRGGRLRALLSEAGGRGAGLAVDSIRIASAVSPRTDATPPTIRPVYPAGSDSVLQPGERILFSIEDSSGIDLTRLDNAHTIFVIVDDRGTPHELTPGFTYEPGSFTRGTVEFTIPSLSQGAHRLEVHASDTFRNIATAVFVIQVAIVAPPGSAIILDQVFNYPNPFPRETFLHARLNQPARLTVRILTVAGRRVREIRLDGAAGENYIPWDGRDSTGENVAIGVYLFHVTAESPSGGRVTAVGRALRTE